MLSMFWNINPYRLYEWIEENELVLKELKLYYNNCFQVDKGHLRIDTLEEFCKFSKMIFC